MRCKICGYNVEEPETNCPMCGAVVKASAFDILAHAVGTAATQSIKVADIEAAEAAAEARDAAEGVVEQVAEKVVEEIPTANLDTVTWNTQGFPVEKKPVEDINIEWPEYNTNTRSMPAITEAVEKAFERDHDSTVNLDALIAKYTDAPEAKQEEETLKVEDLIPESDTERPMFYTFQTKTDEFQKLLDREYDRIHNMYGEDFDPLKGATIPPFAPEESVKAQDLSDFERMLMEDAPAQGGQTAAHRFFDSNDTSETETPAVDFNSDEFKSIPDDPSKMTLEQIEYTIRQLQQEEVLAEEHRSERQKRLAAMAAAREAYFMNLGHEDERGGLFGRRRSEPVVEPKIEEPVVEAKVEEPVVEAPTVELEPAVETPQIEVPEVTVEEPLVQAAEEILGANVETPDIELPEIETPAIEAPEVAVEAPAIETPEVAVEAPAIEEPEPKYPKFDAAMFKPVIEPREIDFSTPEVATPEIEVPEVSVETPEFNVETPEIEVPEINIEEPKSDLPELKFNFNEVETSDFEFGTPEIETPEIEVPEVSVETPAVEVPELKLSAAEELAARLADLEKTYGAELPQESVKTQAHRVGATAFFFDTKEEEREVPDYKPIEYKVNIPVKPAGLPDAPSSVRTVEAEPKLEDIIAPQPERDSLESRETFTVKDEASSLAHIYGDDRPEPTTVLRPVENAAASVAAVQAAEAEEEEYVRIFKRRERKKVDIEGDEAAAGAVEETTGGHIALRIIAALLILCAVFEGAVLLLAKLAPDAGITHSLVGIEEAIGGAIGSFIDKIFGGR